MIMNMDAPITRYDRYMPDVVVACEALNYDQLHGWMRDLLPGAPWLVLDVGAGRRTRVIHLWRIMSATCI